jgi:tetratricopeptide (TPR) repeat protein
MRNLLTIIFLGAVSLLYAQQESPDVRLGNKQYKDSNYVDAEVNYRRAVDKNDQSFEAHYNLGDALFRQEKYPEALEQYAKAEQILQNDDTSRKEQLASRMADTYHNMGNALYAQQQYDKAVTAYQQSLRLNPKDNDTRYNLVKAMQQLQQQQQNQNQDQQQQQQDQQQNQQNDSTQQQQPPQQQQQQQQPPQQSEEQMDKETAEQILQALEQDEQETQEKLQRQQGKKRRVEKEW